MLRFAEYNHSWCPMDVENVKENDGKFIGTFRVTLGATSKPELIVRLGTTAPGKSRPMKLKNISENDKKNVMLRLPNLQTAEDQFKKVSVTDDYTVEEREEIRKYVQDAKAANEKEPPDSKYIWKDRGDPKNGLQVKRFLKRQAAASTV